MKRFHFGKRGLASGVAVVTALAGAGGVAYATIPGPGNVYTACMLKGVGTIRLIDKSLPATNLMSHCTDKETETSWDQAGQPGPAGPQGLKGDPGPPGTNGTNGTDGRDGASVTTAAEPPGANCAVGGVQLTALSGVAYVCNGSDGKDGANGIDGGPSYSTASTQIVSLSSLSAPVAQLALGPGAYAFTASVSVTHDGSQPAAVACFLGGMQFVNATVPVGPNGAGSVTLSLVGTDEFSSPQTVSVSCLGIPSVDATANLVAVKVRSIN
jgi:hypothetical protein